MFKLAKLSWLSDLSGNRMFVNRRGARVLYATQDELLSLRRNGRLMPLSSEGAIDQALLHVVARLKVETAGAAAEAAANTGNRVN